MKPNSSEELHLNIVSSSIPRRVRGVDEHRLMDEMVLYLPETDVILSLNHSARAVWDFIDNKRTMEQIALEIEAQYGDLAPTNFVDLLTDVNSAIMDLHQFGFVQLKKDKN